MNESINNTLSEAALSLDTSVNESINGTINATTTDVFFQTIHQWTGFDLAGSLQYYMIMFVAFLILWIAVRNQDWRNGSKILFASSPFLLTEALITKFGTYTIYLPSGEIVINRFVHVFELLDYVFQFGLFDYFAQPIIEGHLLNVEIAEPTGLLYAIVALLSFGDTIFQILLLSFGMYAILTLIENKFGFQVPFQRIVSLVIGSIPSLVYALSYSNPIHEFDTSKSLVMQSIYFINLVAANGLYIDLMIVLTVLMVSLLLIYKVMKIAVDMFMSFYINVNPSGKAMDYNISYESVTMMIVILYSFVFLFHPEYPWYKILSVLAFLTFFKRFMDSIVAKAKAQNNRTRNQQAFAGMVAQQVTGHGNAFVQQPQKESRLFNFWIPLFVAIVFIAAGFWFML